MKQKKTGVPLLHDRKVEPRIGLSKVELRAMGEEAVRSSENRAGTTGDRSGLKPIEERRRKR
jgi:hypothetical protein